MKTGRHWMVAGIAMGLVASGLAFGYCLYFYKAPELLYKIDHISVRMAAPTVVECQDFRWWWQKEDMCFDSWRPGMASDATTELTGGRWHKCPAGGRCRNDNAEKIEDKIECLAVPR